MASVPRDPEPFYFYTSADFCSNWYPLPFEAPLPTRESILAGFRGDGPEPDSHRFACNEQYMMYAKAVFFNDDQTARQVLKHGSNPRKCKGLGRKVVGFDAALWDQHKEQVVEEGCWRKFTSGDEVRRQLLATGNREIVEASPFDRIWGIGYGASTAGNHRDNWGQNLLGKAISRVRTRLRELPEDQAENATNGP